MVSVSDLEEENIREIKRRNQMKDCQRHWDIEKRLPTCTVPFLWGGTINRLGRNERRRRRRRRMKIAGNHWTDSLLLELLLGPRC